jgi:transposase
MHSAQESEIEVLIGHFNQSKDPKVLHRAQVVALHIKGYQNNEICEVTFHQETKVSRWIRRYKQNGIGSIFPGYYNNQNASKLTREQKEDIKQHLEENPLPVKYWTCEGLKSYMSARFDIEYKSKQSFYALLKFCNYSYKLPSLFDIKRDDEYVEKKVNEIRQEINPLLSDPKWEIFVSDETRIEWDTLTRRAWLQKGRKTIIKEHRDRFYQSFIGFLNLKTGKQYLDRLDWQDQEHIIPTLENLLKKFPDRKLCIIWDNARFHKGKLIQSNLGLGNKLERIHLINMPPYAPDKNPQEHIWRYVKDRISNEVYDQFEKMVEAFESITTGRIYPYHF